MEVCRLHTTADTNINTAFMRERRPHLAVWCFAHVTEMVGVERNVNMHAVRSVVAIRKHSRWFKQVLICRSVMLINPHGEGQRVEGCKLKQVRNTAPAG